MAKLIYPISPLYITQGFGVNPQNYSQFGLKAHNGIDVRTKYTDTPDGVRNILSSFKSRFYKQGNEGSGGYGIYFEVLVQLKSLWKLTYAHCKSINNFVEVNADTMMALSDNTGNSTGSHLHLTTKRLNTDSSVKDYSNGYFGAVDPQQFFDELKEFKEGGDDEMITDQTKIPQIIDDSGNPMEVQAIRSQLLDLRKNNKELKEENEKLKQNPGQNFTKPKAVLYNKLAQEEEK